MERGIDLAFGMRGAHEYLTMNDRLPRSSMPVFDVSTMTEIYEIAPWNAMSGIENR